MNEDHQIGGLMTLDYVSDLFTVGDKDTFTREEILVILNNVRNDPELFEPSLVTAWDNTPEEDTQ